MEWISVNERLPNRSGALVMNKVLVFHRGDTYFGYLFNTGWRLEGSPSYWDDIYYWMPLPEPPKEG